MFKDLFDEISVLWSWRWPIAQGEITAVDLERTGSREERVRLAVAYKFSIGEDGPYTGEVFLTPLFSIGQVKTIRTARRKLHLRQRVAVRYRPDDPSVNTLNGGVRRLLKGFQPAARA